MDVIGLKKLRRSAITKKILAVHLMTAKGDGREPREKKVKTKILKARLVTPRRDVLRGGRFSNSTAILGIRGKRKHVDRRGPNGGCAGGGVAKAV